MKGVFNAKLLSITEVDFIDSLLKNREKEFCVCFAETGDPKLAAAMAGYKIRPRVRGLKLLSRDDIQEEIKRLVRQKEKLMSTLASIGYQRLAFGDASDAVSLLYKNDSECAELGGMDLFMISEIKKPKDGAVEIKFFDRLKALEKLACAGGDSGVKNLFDAIGEAGGGDRGD